MPTFENRFFQFDLDMQQAAWGLRKNEDQVSIQSTFPQIIYLDGNHRKQIKLEAGTEFSISHQVITGLGNCKVWTATSATSDGIGIRVEFALPDDAPLFLIRAILSNQSDRKVLQHQFCILESGDISFNAEKESQSDLSCMVNGWQSWSYSGVYATNQKAVISHLGAFQTPKLYDSATPIVSKKGQYTSDMFGAVLERTHRSGWLIGYLSQCEHFGHLEIKTRPAVKIKAFAAGDDAVVLPGSSVSTDWLAVSALDLKSTDPLASYLDACASINQVQIRAEVPSGWCSWYHYFTRIQPGIIRENLAYLSAWKDDLPVNLVQIDDGYEKSIGDWLETKPGFGGEMGFLADEVREEGKMPGLWIAPFIVSPASDLYKNHPNWMVQNAKGKPANAGWNWARFCTGLDMTHPGAQEYIRQVVKSAVEDLGYKFLKLDFLYAAALPGKRYNPTHTRAKVMRKAMELIREAAGPDTYLLGCGAPLGPSLGIVDGMRIGTDTAPNWEPKYMGIELLFPNDPDIPSAKNALQNTISRSAMHNRWWHNDPDCLLLRPGTNLTLAEVQTYACLVALTGGLMLISDGLNELSLYRLKIAQAMLPGINQRPQVVDWADRLTPRLLRIDLHNQVQDWTIFSYTNWGDKPVLVEIDLERVGLQPGSWMLREFWSGETYQVDGSKFEVQVAPHGTALFVARPWVKDQPAYLGSDLHISQGMELSSWEFDQSGVRFSLALSHFTEGVLDLYIPQPPKQITSDGNALEYTQHSDKIYRVSVDLKRNMDIQIVY